MAYSNITNLSLGDFLQIVYSDGIRNQLSEDYRDWDYIMKLRYLNTAARQYNFQFKTGLAPASVQYRNPGTTGRTFPRAHSIRTNEHTAQFKELNATVELEYNLFDRARRSPEKYAEPLAEKILSLNIVGKRRLAADLYGDGTGVMGTLAASGASVTSGNVKFTLKQGRGHVGFFEYDDILILREQDATASAIDTDLGTEPVYWQVVEKDRENNTVTLKGLDSSFAEVTVSSISVQPGEDEVFYRYDQPTIPDLSSSIADYGTVTESIAGLQSLAANDGRVIHGITMSGASAGSVLDAGGNPIEVKFIQKALSKGKLATGQGAYSWKLMCMSPETHDALVESREGDRRFTTVEDNTRGTKFFAYQHQNDTLETYTSEYVDQQDIWMKPEMKSTKGRVIEYIGSDYETVKTPSGDDFQLKPASGGGYENTIVSHLMGIGVLVCKHPAAIVRVKNFTNS